MKQPAFQIGQTIELTIDRVRMGNTTSSWIVILKDETNPDSVDFQMSLPSTWKREDAKPGVRARCRIQRMRGQTPIVCLDTSAAEANNHPEWGYFDDYVAKKSEGAELEKKTSIVFDPETRRADIPQQLGYNIMREIAALANQRGGYIYFGIHDSDNDTPVRGIHGDFAEIAKWGSLNGRHYSPSVDGYTLIIQDFAKRKLGAGILGLLDFDPLLTAQGLIVLRLYVKPCRGSTPVWYDNEKLFVREGPRCDEKKGSVKTDFLNAWGDHLAKLPPPETDSKDALYFSILSDGAITMRERKRPGSTIIRRVYVSKGASLPGYLLLVFKNGTLVFLDPNQIQREIKENDGFSRYRIPSGIELIAAFNHVDPSYLLALVVWQRELNGFKLFNPEDFFDGEIVPGVSKRFLVEEEMELRECLRIHQGAEFDSFATFHPILKRTGKGFTCFHKDFTRPDESDFGTLVQDVAPGFYADLVQLARTGSSPQTSPRVPEGRSGYLVVSCATWETYRFALTNQPPKPALLGVDPVEPVKLESDDDRRTESPSESWRSWNIAYSAGGQELLSPPVAALEDNMNDPLTGDVVLLFASGTARRIPWTSLFPESRENRNARYLRTREPLRGVYYCHQDDFLVVLLKVESIRFPMFLLVPIAEMPISSRLLVSSMKGGKPAIVECRNILGTGILSGKTISKVASSLRNFWDDFPLADCRCPIDGFSARLWNEHRYSRRDALVCHLNGNDLKISRVVPLSWRWNNTPSLQWVRDTPELSEVEVGFSEIKIPKSLVDQIKPAVLEKLKADAIRANLGVTFVDDDQLPMNSVVNAFLHSALVLDEQTQEVELKFVESPPRFKLIEQASQQGTIIRWEEERANESTRH